MSMSKVLSGAGMSALRDRDWFSGLTFRYLVQSVAVGLFLSVLLIGNAAFQQRRTVFREMEQRGAVLGESLASACSLRYLLGDTEAVRFILDRAKNIEDVVSIALLDRTGRLEMQVPPGRFDPPDMSRKAPVPVSWPDDDFIHVMAPLLIGRAPQTGVADMLTDDAPTTTGAKEEAVLGYIYIRLSLDRAQASVKRHIHRSVLVTMAILVLGSVAGFLFFRRTVLVPIGRLTEAMAQVRTGRLDMSLDSAGDKSEIGTLTVTFNEMTQDLRKAEEALRRANAELEQRVLERTQDLRKANLELQESQERLIRSEKLAAIGQLASGVGHELRNPLAAIRNVVYYIRDTLKESSGEGQDPAIKELLDLADGEIKSATRIIGDLLDFSRVLKLEFQRSHVHAVLREMESVLEVPDSVKIVREYNDGVPDSCLDPGRMRQVFLNLATNAIQAMPKGGELRIRTSTEPMPAAAGRWLRVDFQDTGEGITPDVRRKIFEPLFSTKAKGTGLGLAICAGIIDAHGGKIAVESTPGQGSVFTVRIPVKEAVA
jgi:signal transduction histidine kinase